MKKFLLIVGILAALGVVAVVVLSFYLGNIVTAGVNKFAPQLTQTTVVLNSARISPLSGVGALSGLTIGNPKGWSDLAAFRLGEVHIAMEPFSVLRDHIVIEEIVIDQPEINYETKLISSNVGDLLKNIEAAMGGAKTAEPATKSGKPIKLVVKKFKLTNARVSLGLGVKAMTIPMPTVELNDLGVAQGGITPAELAGAVMRSVTSSVVAVSMDALTKAGGTTGAAATEGIKKAGEAIKGLFGGKK